MLEQRFGREYFEKIAEREDFSLPQQYHARFMRTVVNGIKYMHIKSEDGLVEYMQRIYLGLKAEAYPHLFAIEDRVLGMNTEVSGPKTGRRTRKHGRSVMYWRELGEEGVRKYLMKNSKVVQDGRTRLFEKEQGLWFYLKEKALLDELIPRK